MPKYLYLLHETALGLGLFKVKEAEEISKEGLLKTVKSAGKFQSIVSLEAFSPFEDQREALQSVADLADGKVPDKVLAFLRQSVPQMKSEKKKKKVSIGVCDAALGAVIKQELGVDCRCDELVFELLRGVRQHFEAMAKSELSIHAGDCEAARIGLGHGYSRARVKFNVNRADNMIIQAIAMVDTVDKDLNTYCMRVREWYGWHFPELSRVVPDQVLFAKVVDAVGNKRNLVNASDEVVADTRKKLEDVTEGDSVLCDKIHDLAKSSMGVDVSALDIAQMRSFARRVVSLGAFRQSVHAYLCSRMESCAPNLTALIGEQVGARLISKAGSLIKLAKYPASTVQILGAEKALFRALKSRGKCNTPKYGLIFNSTFISRAGAKDKGRISRYLANKAAMATRLDCFLDTPTNAYGLKFREQVEERLTFFKSGKTPTTNADAMSSVKKQLNAAKDMEVDDSESESDEESSSSEVKSKKQKKALKKSKAAKRKLSAMEVDDESSDEESESSSSSSSSSASSSSSSSSTPPPPPKKKRKKVVVKKQESSDEEESDESEEESSSPAPVKVESAKKKKKQKAKKTKTQKKVKSEPMSSSKKKKKKSKKKKKKSSD